MLVPTWLVKLKWTFLKMIIAILLSLQTMLATILAMSLEWELIFLSLLWDPLLPPWLLLKEISFLSCCPFGFLDAAMIGYVAVGTKEGASQKELLNALLKGTMVASILVVGFSALIIAFLLRGGRAEYGWKIFGCIIIGLFASVLIGQITKYFTSYHYWPTKSITKAGITGPATVIVKGLGVGMISTAFPVLVIVVTFLGCDALSGAYGIAMSAVGMLSTLGVTLATDAYGPVADNAGGIAEMTGLEERVRDTTDALDALGNTTAATGKGFAIGSAVLTALSLLLVLLLFVQFSKGILAVARQAQVLVTDPLFSPESS
jgi:K(+)-stimulated pyrophosphate-energized sodium pump